MATPENLQSTESTPESEATTAAAQTTPVLKVSLVAFKALQTAGTNGGVYARVTPDDLANYLSNPESEEAKSFLADLTKASNNAATA